MCNQMQDADCCTYMLHPLQGKVGRLGVGNDSLPLCREFSCRVTTVIKLGATGVVFLLLWRARMRFVLAEDRHPSCFLLLFGTTLR